MAGLSLDQIRAARATLPRRTVTAPDLGDVEIRMLTLGEVTAIQKMQKGFAEGENLKLYPELLKAACVDPDGKPLFAGADADLIDGLPWPAVDAIAQAILEHNRMGPGGAGPKG